MFPSHSVQMEYLHPQIKYSGSNRHMLLDIFIPSLSLAIEYQGVQHYGRHYLYGSPSDQQKRDIEKRDQCKQLGITLIEIGFWWDGQQSSLAATLRRHRSDLLT